MKVRAKQVSVLALLVAIFGCGESRGRETLEESSTNPEIPSSLPSRQNYIDATHPGYKAQPGAVQECLGRIVFELPGRIEWATAFDDSLDLFNAAFSSKVFDRGDTLTVGRTKIAVFGPLLHAEIEEIFRSTARSNLSRQKLRLEEMQEQLKSLKYERLSQAQLAYQKNLIERRIERLVKRIEDHQAEFEEFDTRVLNAEGHWRGSEGVIPSMKMSTFGAYLKRDNYVYVFESTATLTASLTKDVHANEFRTLLSKFKTRRPFEIPSERGVCIPNGFIPDDGTTRTETKQSLRFPDAPGVLYTVHTGSVHARGLKFTPLEAAARARMGNNGTFEDAKVKPYVTKRIGPRLYKIGGLTGEQGGVAMKITKPGTDPYETYSIFTGYSGWLGSAVLPFITVDMTTRTTLQAPELKINPPVFKQSMSRLEFILKNMRLRPTTPLMPELATRRE